MHLLEKKAFINAKDLVGRTPLFNAAKMSRLRELKALLAAKANPLIMTQGGKTPYIVARNKSI